MDCCWAIIGKAAGGLAVPLDESHASAASRKTGFPNARATDLTSVETRLSWKIAGF
jgi:hypothetical protein